MTQHNYNIHSLILTLVWLELVRLNNRSVLNVEWPFVLAEDGDLLRLWNVDHGVRAS
jgi:hypothetical protein